MENLLILFSVLGFAALCVVSQTLAQCFITMPQCPNRNVTFFLYTRKIEKNPQQLSMKNEKSILNADFVPGRPLFVIIHGYTGSYNNAPNSEIRPELLKNNEYNIISVDYRPLAEEPCYLQAVRNLRVVANCTAQLIDFMIMKQLFSSDDIHVIGFSLGAQTSGMISNYLQTGSLKRITGLDPAKPMFMTANNKYRLDRSDAEFVEVIHTDVFGRGILQPMGHVDFYANGGITQPGCQNHSERSVGSCNHQRAPDYYAESINSLLGFWGYECDHWYLYATGMCQRNNDTSIAQMGFLTPNSTRGLYFVETKSNKPFAKGKYFASKSILEVIDEFDDK